MKASRSRRTTLNPLKFTDNGENCDISNVNIQKSQNIKKHKRSMYSSIKRSPSIEKILAENKNKKENDDADTELKEELEIIKRRDSIISRQRHLFTPDSPSKSETTIEESEKDVQPQDNE